ncbi:helix-turn-helix domain-containing protein [Burkholderia cenocepacia]|uniref:helix-turn-helix transcriptional regulator n=1 Tax=Burkholderia cenocepacia TaxID=95486 RepID=UPI001B9EA5D2|nr:helix-turn-helix domain-containing protein [Burkholderia cenocepacia]MBR8378004.1 helix-turn-helix domain-containing protein [Burkholderia cenocepacia]
MPYVSKTFKAGVAVAAGHDLALCDELLDLLADRIASRVAARLRERPPVPPVRSQGLTTAGASPAVAPTLRPDSLYRVAYVMQRLGVSKATVYNLARAGKLELVKIGMRSSGVTGKSLIALIERNHDGNG